MIKIFCWGTFDILHKGHLDFLKDVKSRGDKLYLFLISDNSVYINKGRYPKNNQKERELALKGLGIVDEIILQGNDLQSNFNLIASLQPDIFAFGYDQQTEIEDKLKRFFTEKGMNIKFYTSKEFAGGIHSSHLR